MTDELTRRGILRTGMAGMAGIAAALTVLSAGAATARPRDTAPGVLADVRAAARDFGVPPELLLALGYANTRWEMPPPGAGDYRFGDPEARGSHGVMALVRNPWEDTLGLAAELTGLPVQALMTDRAANLRGGAAVLAHSQGRQRPGRSRDWLPAVAGHGGGGPRIQAATGIGSGDLYAEQVGDVLAGGFDHRTTSKQRVVLAPQGQEL
ncbi:hypothetical protein [Nocardioides mesophilus]|uniref:Uncharacterized protein n=1 Tax=Nocardioides mesophilus TaxID=433659 RepID=A0A7G9RCD1_9ACTN|nr:hypothetical protein [Nocardioides mesophilus]QNN53256.1 hypothetical protein H9L09_01850 [Nocardioides mesophilus]